jgi:hypothetical protein
LTFLARARGQARGRGGRVVRLLQLPVVVLAELVVLAVLVGLDL